MDDTEGSGVPWKSVVLWVVAAAVGGLCTWEFSQADFIRTIREVQVTNSSFISAHNEQIKDLQRQIELINTTKTDKRFRSDDWDSQRKILDAEFKAVWKAIDECKRPR